MPYLAHCKPVTNDDRRRVDLVPDQLISTFQKLGRHNDHRRGAIAHLLVLQLCQLHQDLCQKVPIIKRNLCWWYSCGRPCITASVTMTTTDLGCRLLDLKEPEDGCAIIRDRDIADVVDKHLVQTFRS